MLALIHFPSFVGELCIDEFLQLLVCIAVLVENFLAVPGKLLLTHLNLIICADLLVSVESINQLL